MTDKLQMKATLLKSWLGLG